MRIVHAYRLLKSSLTLKTGTHVCCLNFGINPFLTEEEWKTVGKFEAILRDASRSTTIFQNEERLNSTCGIVMRKPLHDSLPRGTMHVVNADMWSISKAMIHPTRSKINTNSFANTRKPYMLRAILECERMFFNKKNRIFFCRIK